MVAPAYLSILAGHVHPFMAAVSSSSWPPQSLDLSPSEHLWNVIELDIDGKYASTVNIDQDL